MDILTQHNCGKWTFFFPIGKLLRRKPCRDVSVQSYLSAIITCKITSNLVIQRVGSFPYFFFFINTHLHAVPRMVKNITHRLIYTSNYNSIVFLEQRTKIFFRTLNPNLLRRSRLLRSIFPIQKLFGFENICLLTFRNPVTAIDVL